MTYWTILTILSLPNGFDDPWYFAHPVNESHPVNTPHSNDYLFGTFFYDLMRKPEYESSTLDRLLGNVNAIVKEEEMIDNSLPTFDLMQIPDTILVENPRTNVTASVEKLIQTTNILKDQVIVLNRNMRNVYMHSCLCISAVIIFTVITSCYIISSSKQVPTKQTIVTPLTTDIVKT
jgi:hypothetical protein